MTRRTYSITTADRPPSWDDYLHRLFPQPSRSYTTLTKYGVGSALLQDLRAIVTCLIHPQVIFQSLLPTANGEGIGVGFFQDGHTEDVPDTLVGQGKTLNANPQPPPWLPLTQSEKHTSCKRWASQHLLLNSFSVSVVSSPLRLDFPFVIVANV